MPENKITCAVIGAGNMGKNHVRTYAGLVEADLAAIVDVNSAIAEKMALDFSTKYFSDYKKMIEEVKPEVVSICVPTHYHYEVAKHCLEHKVHVLLEKPIASSLEQAGELISIASQNGVQLLVGHIERFNPAVRKVKEMIDKGEIGKVTAIIARRVGGFPPQIKDANIAVDLAIHDIDIVNFLLGVIPFEVSVAKKKNHIEQREDSVEFFLKYAGASAYVQANWITPVKIRKLTITGTEGYLEMDYISQQIEFYKSNYEKFREDISGFSDYILRFSEPDKITIAVAKKEPLMEEIIYFLNQIKNNIQIDSQFAVDALKIVLN